MYNYEKQLNRVIREIEDLMYIIERDDNVMEYLIESGMWDECCERETNVLNIIEKVLI